MIPQREMTSQELKVLVDEWEAAGGVITQVPPGAALNFRADFNNPSKANVAKTSPFLNAARRKKMAKMKENRPVRKNKK